MDAIISILLNLGCFRKSSEHKYKKVEMKTERLRLSYLTLQLPSVLILEPIPHGSSRISPMKCTSCGNNGHKEDRCCR